MPPRSIRGQMLNDPNRVRETALGKWFIPHQRIHAHILQKESTDSTRAQSIWAVQGIGRLDIDGNREIS